MAYVIVGGNVCSYVLAVEFLGGSHSSMISALVTGMQLLVAKIRVSKEEFA